MGGRKPTTKARKRSGTRDESLTPLTLPLFPTEDEISVCEVLARLCPAIDCEVVLQRLREDSADRRDRVRSLRRRIRVNEYSIQPAAVVDSLLAEGDLLDR